MSEDLRRLRVHGFQAMITAESWRDLLANGAERALSEGDRLISQGAPGTMVYALRRGRVRVVYTEANGDEALVAIRGGGDLVGEYAQRDRSEHMASVLALENGQAVALTAERFEAFIDRHRLTGALQQYMLAKARQVGARVWRAANLRTEQRVAQLFLEVVQAGTGDEAVTIPMAQGQIASSLGISRRSVSFLMAQWREQHLVRTQPPPITLLDLDALSQRANAFE